MRRAFLAVLVTCHLGPALAVGPETSPLDSHPSYERAKALIEAQDYAAAIPILTQLRSEHPDSPDLYNWLGFSHRKLRNYPLARQYYDRALSLDPDHRGANEYLGELFVETGDLPRARERLSHLRKVCGACEEAKDLEKAIAAVDKTTIRP